MRARTAVLAVVSALVAALLWSVPTGARIPGPGGDRPQACEPARSIKLFAEDLGGGRIGYGRAPDKAKVPGPTLTMTEGECLAIRLVNETDGRVGLHMHGVRYTTASDATRLNRSCVGAGYSRVYVFEANEPFTRSDGSVAPGTAGYWNYHDHCRGTAHGTGGINAGLFGALIVRREGDLRPDRNPFVVVMKDLTINLEVAPATPIFKADQGDRVEFVVIGHGNLFHTFHLHGHRWADNRTGEPSGLSGDEQVIDNRTIGPADSFGFQVIAGEGVGPGAWMYHCHVQGHSDFGMSGIFLVRDPDGLVPVEARRTLRAWRSHAAHAKGRSGAHHSG